jgi:hypothetical protein
VTALLLAGCSPPPERLIIDQFFSASRLRDRTALQSFSTVTFEPREQGIVTDFTIVRVTPEQRSTVNGSEIVSKNVRVSASVKRRGQIAQKTLVITMQRTVANGPDRGPGGWIITGVATA